MNEPRNLDCNEVSIRLDDYVDRALSPSELEEVRAHLDQCALCALEERFGADVIADIKAKLRRIRAPDGLRQRIAAMLAEAE